MGGKSRLFVALALIVCLALAVTPAMAEKLKVGVMGPFTGPSAKAGNEFKTSVQMVLEKIGGKIGDYELEE